MRLWLVVLLLGCKAVSEPPTAPAIGIRTAAVQDGTIGDTCPRTFRDYVPCLDALQIGPGIVIQAVKGTQGAKMRLGIYGLAGNGAEIELVPDAGRKAPGVISQIQLLAPPDERGYLRLAFSLNRDAEGHDYGVVDMTSSGTRPLSELVVNQGEGKASIFVHPDGTVTIADKPTAFSK